MLFAVTLVATAQAPGPLLASAQGTLKTWGSTAREAAGEALRRIPNPLPGLIPSTPSLPDMATIQASRTALTDIPSSYLARYVVTDRAITKSCPALTWQLLAAIGKVESDHGRSPAPEVRSGVNRFGCCAGAMQFNITNGPPSTWDTWGTGVRAHVYDPAYAVPAAARKLCGDGLAKPEAVGRDPCPQVQGSAALHVALKRYNNACWYVHEIVTLAGRYTASAPPRVAPA